MICISLQNKNLAQILDVLSDPEVEMAEIRLDRCPLGDEEITELFEQSDTPLIATCRLAEAPSEQEAERRLRLAVEAGARFADLEIEAPAPVSKRFQQLCRRHGTEIIRSYHNFEKTPDQEGLQMALARCFRYGADIAKIVTTCQSSEDADRIEALYTIVLEGVDSLQGRLIAFGMGEAGRQTRLECLRRGAPFTYAALTADEATAPGQWSAAEMHAALYEGFEPYRVEGRTMPASKSFAQRAILAAALAEGTSHLRGYSPCGDSEAAIRAAQALGATVQKDGSTLTVTGIGTRCGQLALDRLDTGESGLLTRLCIPVLAAIGPGSFTVEGCGTLLRRPLAGAADIMAAYGVLLGNASPREGWEIFVPASVKGHLIPGTADISGKGGSQLISGLLTALPLCEKDSTLHVSEPKSIPYMYITLDVLHRFGIQTRSEMEGDAEMLEANDWSACTGISFRIRGRQRYRSADFAIEGDWSAAANFLVAGAVFGSAELCGLDTRSLQADLTIIDILVEAGAVVSQLDDGVVCVRKAPLEAFHQDLSNAPDLFPIVAVLAAFCAGESRISGVGRLAGKESNRAEAILQMLLQMGVDAVIEGDELVVCGESLSARILNGRLLEGGEYTSRHDHRMVMALKVASLGAKSPIVIDDEACVGKSFPGFRL
jgi:3-phosphoshikimate 1-carboxyvinyltransferase